MFGSVMVAPLHRSVCDVHARMFEVWGPKAKILIDIDCEPVISTRFGDILKQCIELGLIERYYDERYGLVAF